MAFKNEYGTEEDIAKYKLDELWFHFAPTNKRAFHGRKPELTIDRENDIVMMVRSSSPVEQGTQKKFIFSIMGQMVCVILNLVEGSSPGFDDRPFYRVWDLVLIKKDDSTDLRDEEIISTAKKAVTVFGYDGIRHQVPETIVKFNF